MQLISLTYQPSQYTIRIITNSFSFVGLALDIVGAFFGYIDMADLERHRTMLEELELKKNDPEFTQANFNQEFESHTTFMVGFIPLAALAFGILCFIVAFMCFIHQTQPPAVFIATIIVVGFIVGLYLLLNLVAYIRRHPNGECCFALCPYPILRKPRGTRHNIGPRGGDGYWGVHQPGGYGDESTW